MTVAIIIVAVTLPGCMIDRTIKSARSLNLPPCMISSCKRDSSRAKCVNMGKIFLSAFSLQFVSKLNMYIQCSKIEIYLEIRGCDNLRVWAASYDRGRHDGKLHVGRNGRAGPGQCRRRLRERDNRERADLTELMSD